MSEKSRTSVGGASADWPQFTTEKGLYAALILMGLGLRLGGLGLWPALREELSHAVPALMAARGQPGATLGYSPLLHSFNLLAFITTGPSDTVIRLVPVFFGTLLVSLPYFLRQTLGRVGSLVASLCLAVSPTFLFYSRTSSGAIVVAACALIALSAVQAHGRDGRVDRLKWGVAALALALTAGSETYTYLFIALMYVAWLALMARSEEGIHRWTRSEELARAVATKKNLLVGGAVLILASTAALFNPSGVQASLALFATWAQRLKPLAGGRPWYYYAQLLVIYEMPILILGLIGLALSIRHKDGFGRAMGFWVVLGLLFYTVLGPRQPGALLVILLPLVMLTGRAAESLSRWAVGLSWWELVLTGLSIPVLGLGYLRVAQYVHAGTATLLVPAAIIVILLVVTFVAFGFWIGAAEALRGGGLVLLVVGVVVLTRTTVRLNYRYARHPLEPLVVSPTSAHVLDMVREVSSLSQHEVGDQHAIEILVEQELEPYMAWLLRDFPNVQYVRSVPSDVDQHVIIVSEASESQRPLGYVGERFAFRSREPVLGLSTRDWLRWLALGEITVSVEREDLMVWVKVGTS